MKFFLIILILSLVTTAGYSQKQLISYEDLKYLVENNLQHADSFLVAKGYGIDKSSKRNNHKYNIKLQGGTTANIELRADGKRILVEILTDELSQYNLIYNSIAPYLLANANNSDIQSYNVKDLGMVYISVNDKVPYSPIRKDYDIHLVTDKLITSYN